MLGIVCSRGVRLQPSCNRTTRSVCELRMTAFKAGTQIPLTLRDIFGVLTNHKTGSSEAESRAPVSEDGPPC